MAAVAIGIDLGGTKLLGALVDAQGRILEKLEEPTDAPRGADAVVASVAAVTRVLAERARRDHHDLRGVGVGVPGPIDPTSGTVHAMANMGDTWRRYPLRERLARLLPGLNVFVENDANAAIHGEAFCGACAGMQDAVLLTLGTGVGGGIVASGVLIRGSRGVGAELGHVVVHPEGHPCGCTGRGCLEQYASGTGVARLAAEALARSPSGLLAKLGRPPSTLEVVAAARQGDALALSVLDEAARWLGIGLVTIVHTLNPEVVVIGGGFGTAAFDLLVPKAEAVLAGRSFEASREGFRIVPARLGADAGVVGAARSALV